MKTNILKAFAIALLLTGTAYQSKAQISVNINIGAQPTWGPVGYDRVDYYYLPDIECYYSVPAHQFIYLSNGRWIYASYLPARYSNYDLYSGYKVVVNRPRPYLNFSEDRVRYGKYKGWKGKQEIIRNSRDERYHGNPHGMPPGQAKKYDRDDDRGHGRDKDRGKEDKHGKGHGHGHDD